MNSLLSKICIIPFNRVALSIVAGATLALAALPAVAGTDITAYTPPDLSGVNTATLRQAYATQLELQYLLAPIHSRAELKEYLKVTANSGSPLDALTPDARQRFLSGLMFTSRGLASFGYADLQYLSATQIYRILSLFGVQDATPLIHDAQILSATDEAIMKMPAPYHDYNDHRCDGKANCIVAYYVICIGQNCVIK